MRLLGTSTFELKSFFDRGLPPYAILSHTWGDQEVTIQELQDETSTELLRSLKIHMARKLSLESYPPVPAGFVKIVGCALQAEADGFEYIWIDTCCIDKTTTAIITANRSNSSSAELSEAINSMYHWYKDQLCYAYLSDVMPSDRDPASGENLFSLRKSRWFKRGWTLQELIAPASVSFFNSGWQLIGTRAELSDVISEVTGIDKGIFYGDDVFQCSIAKRMSWAPKRDCTRTEDTAYCLMGILDVHMPLLYGERERSFIRLQEEVMKIHDDHSLFAWKIPHDPSRKRVDCGLLANWPNDFSESRNFVPLYQNREITPYSMTNRGVSICLPMLMIPDGWLAVLDCQDETDARGPVALFLRPNQRGTYSRYNPHQIIPASSNDEEILNRSGLDLEKTRIYVPQHANTSTISTTYPYMFHLQELPDEQVNDGVICEVFANERREQASWDVENRLLSSFRGLAAAIYIGRQDGLSGLVLLVGIDSNFRPRWAFDSGFDLAFAGYNRLLLAEKLLYHHSGASREEPRKGEMPTTWDDWISRQREHSTYLEMWRSRLETTRTLQAREELAPMRKKKPKAYRLELEKLRALDWVVRPVMSTKSVRGRMVFSLALTFEFPQDDTSVAGGMSAV
ncbi:Vegetative incompatibility protein HET-E-1 [Lachnellula suecica]|uniref:Vegetative incompatibility protein HET-E-1 n=1 Tax=Lachnellula suecica TaxID=602035 RepID=A0A8T9CGH7_9HELO|nr:Vegetative incompatibility protein HET-E-1 [Lachnellula suecica]